MMETKDKDNLDEAKINELINDFKEASLKGGEIETSLIKRKSSDRCFFKTKRYYF